MVLQVLHATVAKQMEIQETLETVQECNAKVKPMFYAIIELNFMVRNHHLTNIETRKQYEVSMAKT